MSTVPQSAFNDALSTACKIELPPTTTRMAGKRIAVVGGGVSGLGAAWLLARGGYSVVVYESKQTVGGHARTTSVAPAAANARSISVDTGFIVYNTATYPDFVSLLEILRVPQDNSSMSFAVSADMPDGYLLEWGSDSLSTLFADRRNLARSEIYTMLWDVRRFNAAVHAFAERLDANPATAEASQTLAEFLTSGAYSSIFIHGYLVPMVSSVWSASFQDALAFPACTLFRFFINHGLAQTFARPQWRTILRRSRDYVGALVDDAMAHGAVIHTSAFVEHVVRSAESVRIVLREQSESDSVADRTFDHVIFATHAPDTLRILGSGASDSERRILGAFRYSQNVAVVHTDERLMPVNRGAWGAWNFIARKRSRRAGSSEDSVPTGDRLLPSEAQPVCVSYWLNRLQNLNRGGPDIPDVFETLNPRMPIAENKVLMTDTFSHPQFTLETVRAQEELQNVIQGENRSWFCGAYARHGFHEDGLMTGLDVAERLTGYKLLRPWRSKPCLAINNNYKRYQVPFVSSRSFGLVSLCALSVIHVVGARILAGLHQLASRLTHSDPSVILSSGNGILLRFGHAVLPTSNPGLVNVRSPQLFARVTDAIRHHRDLTPVAVAAFVAGELDCPLPSDLTAMLHALIVAQKKGPELGHGLQGQMHLAETLLHTIVGGFAAVHPPKCESRLSFVTTAMRQVVYAAWWRFADIDHISTAKFAPERSRADSSISRYSQCFVRHVSDLHVHCDAKLLLEFCGDLCCSTLWWMLTRESLHATIVVPTIDKLQQLKQTASRLSLLDRMKFVSVGDFFRRTRSKSLQEGTDTALRGFDIIVSPSIVNLCHGHFASMADLFGFIGESLTVGGIAELGFCACDEARIGNVVKTTNEDAMYCGDNGFQMWATRVVLDAAEGVGLSVEGVHQMQANQAAAGVHEQIQQVFSRFVEDDLTELEIRTVLGQFCMWEAALLSGVMTRVALTLRR